MTVSAKARRRAPSIAASPWDHGATGPANRHGLVIEERGEVDPKTGRRQNPNGVTGARRVDMLEVYHRRGWISDAGYDAAVRLRNAWLRTEMGRGQVWSFDRVDGGGSVRETVEVQIDRISALVRLSDAISDGDRRIIECVAFDGTGIGALREYRGRRHQSGVAAMREALDRLAERMDALGL